MAKLYNIGAERAEGVAAAASALKQGLLVGLPTETVYGLAADATRPDAVARIFATKGRPRFNPLIVHVASAETAADVAELGDLGEKLAAAFWPGPLTLVAPMRQGTAICDLVTTGLTTVAVRVPEHPVALEVLRSVDFPLAAPSANPSGRVSATTAADVAEELGDRIAVILDAGPASIGLESTIVAIGSEPRLLRPGAITAAAIGEVTGARLRPADANASPEAPGMMRSHYAPSVPVRLNATDLRPGEALLAFGTVIVGADKAAAIINLSERGDLSEAAGRLFSALRALDRAGAPIAVMPIPDEGLGEAINDRLRRAAAPREH